MQLYFGYEFDLGYQLTENQDLELWYDKNAYIPLFYGCNGSEGHESFYTGLRYRLFLGNSFNISGLAYYDRRKEFCDLTFVDSTLGKKPTAVHNDVNDYDEHGFGLGFSLGNRWQFPHFYIGGEWIGIGLSQPFKQKLGRSNSDLRAKLILSRFTIGTAF
jgi:hypothetical protein